MPDAEEGTVGRSIFEGLFCQRVFKNAFKQIRLINLLDDKFSSVFESTSVVS